MRLPPRLPIVGLLTILLVVSVGLLALLLASATCAGALYLLVHGVFILAIVGAACRGASERPWWLGFALFGLCYLRGEFGDGFAVPMLPTTALLDMTRPHGVDPYLTRFNGPFNEATHYYWAVGHCLWSFLAAGFGGIVAQTLFAASTNSSARREAGPTREDRPARAPGLRYAAVGLAGLVTVAALVRVGLRSAPALLAGAVYLLTWAVLGVAAIGFACVRGKSRMTWFGAALFGLGYMFLTGGMDTSEEGSHVHRVANRFLIAVRPWLPSVVSGFPAPTAAIAMANVRIMKALERRVPMTFPVETPLEDVLRYVWVATRAPDGGEISIHVDPVGLMEAEKTMQSPIRIDLEGQPLNLTLRLALEQLGLIYYVSDGIVYITGLNSSDAPIVVDYYLLLGNCFLALLAAGLGASSVAFVSDRKAGPTA